MCIKLGLILVFCFNLLILHFLYIKNVITLKMFKKTESSCHHRIPREAHVVLSRLGLKNSFFF